MHVLLTTDTIGGVWTYTRELAVALVRTSHSVTLVSFGRLPSMEQQRWCDRLAAQYPHSFHYVASSLPLEWMPNNDCVYHEGERLLLRVAEEFGAELLHSNQFCFGRLPLSIPKVVAAHSDVLSWAAACRPLGLGSGAWLSEYISLVQEGLLASDAVVAPTQWMLNALAANFRLPRRALVIENGRSLRPAAVSETRSLQAVTVGRLWDEAKNLAILDDVRTTVPILVAGESRLADCTAPHLIGHSIFLGPLSEDDLLALFRASALYIATSIYEPFGLAPIEAALCGCAVLANDIPSLREVWGDAALYFKDGTTLSDLLGRLSGDATTLRECAARSQQRALHFSGAAMTSRYLELYRHLVSNTGREAAAAEVSLCVA